MPRFKDQAFIIDKREFGESDLIITLFSRSRGRVSAIAKGAKRSRRRFPGSLEIFSRVACAGFIRHPLALARIDECRLLEPYSGIQKSLAGYYCGCYFLEVIQRCCPERQANEEIFELLEELLAYLDAADERHRNFSCQIRLFELQFITRLGIRPRLDSCLGCRRELGKNRRLFFSPRTGGLVCDLCRAAYPEAFPVSRGTINLLNRAPVLDRDLRAKLNFTPQVENESARLCRALLSWHSGYEFASLKLLEKELARTRRPDRKQNGTTPTTANPRPERLQARQPIN